VITSSLLTLVVVPVVYTFLDDLAAWARRRWGAAPPPVHKMPAFADPGAPTP
jgi:hydrophobic/amphiphilic exporter-1 (mainly G- bacteria), HAE1 family